MNKMKKFYESVRKDFYYNFVLQYHGKFQWYKHFLF